MDGLRLYAVTSGWDGPFQLSEVIVSAPGEDAAVASAESAFRDAGQPICRAKMQIAELGPVSEGVVLGPHDRRIELPGEWRPVGRRCDPVESQLP